MRAETASADKTAVFEQMPIPAALAKMAVPTIINQLITLIYNVADTWFIGQTNNPYMVAASSLFGMTGIVWTQMTADFLNVIISYLNL